MTTPPRDDPLYFKDPTVHAFALGLLRDSRAKRPIRVGRAIVRVTSFLVCGILAFAAVIAWTEDAPAWAFAFAVAFGLAAGLGIWLSVMTTAVLRLTALSEAALEMALVQAGLRELPDAATSEEIDLE